MKYNSICIMRSNPVQPDSRVEKEAFSLAEAGYNVHILAWDRDSNHKAVNEYVHIKGKNIPITRLGYKASFGEGFKNIIPFLKFQCGMRKFIRENKFDVVHACDFDTAFFSQNLVKRKKEKFIFDIFDFLASKPKNLFQYVINRTQIKLINKSDGTIICTEDRKKQISGSKPKQLVVIHNTPSPDLFVGDSSFKVKIDNSKIAVSYIGILQDFRLLKEISTYFIEHSEIEWHVGGFGKYEEYFINLSILYDNIKFYGRISYNKTIELEKCCDINLAIYDPNIDNHKFAAPNKFYESLMLGKPIIMVKDTGMSNIVSENNIGVLIDYSKQGFEKGIEELILRKNEWPIMAKRMREIYSLYYSWEIMEKRLIKLYESI